jgi:hypothetical protein
LAEDIVLNFGGDAAEPVSSSGPRFDRIPPGTYFAKPSLEAGTTSTDKPVANATITISRGPLKGKKVRDGFILPRKGTDDSPFGQRRLHGLVVAVGIKPLSGKKVALSKILQAVSGRECLVEIDDGEMPASGNYAARAVSQPIGYYNPKSKEGQKKIAAAKGDGDEEDAIDDEEAEDEAESGDDESDDEAESSDDEGEEEEEEEPPKKKRSDKGGKSADKPKAKKKADDDESVDDLFDDE